MHVKNEESQKQNRSQIHVARLHNPQGQSTALHTKLIYNINLQVKSFYLICENINH